MIHIPKACTSRGLHANTLRLRQGLKRVREAYLFERIHKLNGSFQKKMHVFSPS
ncbi:MAG: hypothetical protein HEEMFOPI_01878 [Holosporales bacterium]